MRGLFYTIAGLLMIAAAASCKKQVLEVQAPVISFYQVSEGSQDSLVTEALAGRPLNIVVQTDADVCTVWPAGDRVVLKSVADPSRDSTDVFGKLVLVRSDDFIDYGLVNARGRLMSGSPASGYSLRYVYHAPGTYQITFIAIKHGLSGPEYENKITRQTLVVK